MVQVGDTQHLGRGEETPLDPAATLTAFHLELSQGSSRSVLGCCFGVGGTQDRKEDGWEGQIHTQGLRGPFSRPLQLWLQ